MKLRIVPSYLVLLTLFLLLAGVSTSITCTKPPPRSNTLTAGASETALKLLQSVPTGEVENVFLVVIDGARFTETLGDPLHQYIPHIWNDLRPIGSINTMMYNNGVTETTPGHASMLTGIWQKIGGGERPHNPTIFEYYRKQTGAPSSKTWIVCCNYYVWPTNYSDAPGWGAEYGADEYNPCGPASENRTDTRSQGEVQIAELKADLYGSDKNILDKLKQIMKKDAPSLVMVNFADVDYNGHLGRWSRYSNALLDVDTLIYYLWMEIQTSPGYKDHTTLIVTNDHGRFLDGVSTGFRDHGGTDEGCRHIMFLALGPNINTGLQVETPREQIDIGPTMAAMMNISMTQSAGHNMTELLRPDIKSPNK